MRVFFPNSVWQSAKNKSWDLKTIQSSTYTGTHSTYYRHSITLLSVKHSYLCVVFMDALFPETFQTRLVMQALHKGFSYCWLFSGTARWNHSHLHVIRFKFRLSLLPGVNPIGFAYSPVCLLNAGGFSEWAVWPVSTATANSSSSCISCSQCRLFMRMCV